MPVYEFCCKNCGNKFEDLIYKTSELDSIKCPKCDSKIIERLFSVFGFGCKNSDSSSSSMGVSCTGCQRTTCAGCK